MMRTFISLIVLTALFLCAAPGGAQEQGIFVDAGAVLGQINPYVYGVNYGPWALVAMDMQEEAAEAYVTHLRFPAGRHGDLYNVPEQQIDLFMMQARAWGADVSISVRLEGGTPEQAAEMVRYVNIEKGYSVRHWSIGNEPDLFPDYTADRFNEEWRAMALAMEAVDPTILLLGPEVSQFPPTVEGDTYTNVRREWVRSFLEVNGDLVDIVTVHRYPFPKTNASPATTDEDLRQNAVEWDITIENLRTVIVETMGHEMPMGFTEVNSDWAKNVGGSGTPDSFYNAIWWADVLGRMIRQRVELVNFFAFSSFGDLGPYGLLDRFEVRPVYHVYQMYQHFGDELLASTSSDTDVTVTAARRDDGALTLMVVNRALDARSLPLTIEGATVSGEAEVWLFDADHEAENIGLVPLESGGTVELPPQSITLYVVGS